MMEADDSIYRQDEGHQPDGDHVHVHVHVHKPDRTAPASPENMADEQPKSQESQQAGQDKKPGNGNGNGKTEQPRTRWPLIALIIFIIIAVIGGIIYWLLTRDLISTDDAYTDGRAVTVASHVSGYVTALAVNDNQFVHKGDLLVQIEQSDFIAARDQAAGQIAALDAQLADAKITVEKAHITFPAQLKQAEGQVMQARGQLFQANADYKRQHKVERAATSQQNIDTSTASQQQARGQLQQAQAQVDQARLITQNVAQAEAQEKQLEGQLAQARASYQQAAINLAYTRIVAPQDGWVTKRNVEMGNYVQSGAQILALVTPDLWVTANFKETELTRMRPGQHVDIVIDAYPDLKLSGHVDSIQRGSGSKFTAFPPENATGNFVKIVQRVPVKIDIDSGFDRNAPPPLGLSVEPTVTLR